MISFCLYKLDLKINFQYFFRELSVEYNNNFLLCHKTTFIALEIWIRYTDTIEFFKNIKIYATKKKVLIHTF